MSNVNHCFSAPRSSRHSIRIETLNEFLTEHGLQKYEPPKSLTLKNCFSAFPLVHAAIKTKENLRRLTFETLADLSYANCIYAEIRTTPRALNDINKAGYLETVIECFKEWEEGDSRLIPRLIVSVDRSKSLREAEEVRIKLSNDSEKNVSVGFRATIFEA